MATSTEREESRKGHMHIRTRHRILPALLTLMLIGVSPSAVAQSSADTASAEPISYSIRTLPIQYDHLDLSRTIVARDLPSVGNSSSPPPKSPFFTTDQGHQPSTSSLNQVPVSTVAIRNSQSQPNAAQGNVEQTQTSFPVIDQSSQISLFGSDQASSPPDSQLAAGPNYLMEMVNNSGTAWTKSGSLVKAWDLRSFFPVPTGYNFSDPRIVFDAASGIWFASGMSLDQFNDGQVYIANSVTSDPTGQWHTGMLTSHTGVVLDQPKLGVNDDKIVVSWNDEGSTGFLGQETWVLQKSDMISGTFSAYAFFGPDTTRSGIVPSQSLSSTSTEYLVYNNSHPPNQNQSYPSVGLVAISGTPSLRNVQWSEADIQMVLTFPPPAAVQPFGPTIMTDDDRFLSASWQSGTLWTAGNDGCWPTGDSTFRSCARLLPILTGGSTPSVLQSFNLGVAGSYVFYPAVTVDSLGDAFFSLSISSSSLYASAATTFQPVGAPANTVGPIVLTQQGFGVYDDCGNTCSPTNPQQGNRWGDYSGAARDPSNPAMIWVTAEYAGSSTNPFDWGTGTAQVYLASPAATATSTPTPTATPLCVSQASVGQPERKSTPNPRTALSATLYIPVVPNGYSSC